MMPSEKAPSAVEMSRWPILDAIDLRIQLGCHFQETVPKLVVGGQYWSRYHRGGFLLVDAVC